MDDDLVYLNDNNKENEMQEYKVLSSQVFRQGTGAKGPWTIYQVQLEGYPSNDRITGFDAVSVGQMVTVEATQKGQYANLNYKVKKDAAPAPAAYAPQPTAPNPAVSATGADPRVLKLLVLIAEQIGVSKEEVMAILQG